MSLALPPDLEPATRQSWMPEPGTPLPSHFKLCFGCGVDHPTGLHIQMVAAEGPAVAGVMTVTENHQGALGLIHGGVLSAAFDEVLGYVLWAVGKVAVTAHLETDFKAPIPVGTTLFFDGRCDGVAGRKIFVSGTVRLRAVDGPLAATAQALFVAVGPEHFQKHGSGGVSDGTWMSNP